MAKQNSFALQENSPVTTDAVTKPETIAIPKQQFVEPEISTPVDVLEATTFFQAVTSGVV